MRVIATAGHVDHGKSTLIRALTGMEPDRWAEERRRGMTIDLGYAWTEVPGGETVAFVDVPGHERFIVNMLAGVGPVPGVLLVVAADEGWCQQTTEHLEALDALGVENGVLVISRGDLGYPDLAAEEARGYLAGTSLAGIESVAVSAVTGVGLPELRSALGRLAGALGTPEPSAATRLWIDRAFSIRGAGTVVTGTLGIGRIAVGDELRVARSDQAVRVRGIECLKTPVSESSAVSRVAVNLRGADLAEIRRGDALIAADLWSVTTTTDVRLVGGVRDRLPAEAVLHVGAAAVACHLRPLGADTVRLRLAGPVPLHVGDRALLRDPGAQRIVGGVVVLDTDPEPLRRRGSAAARAAELAHVDGSRDAVAEVRRRRAVPRADLVAAGVLRPDEAIPANLVERAGWVIEPGQWDGWLRAASASVDEWARAHPMFPGQPGPALTRALGLPDGRLLAHVVNALPDLVIDADGVHRSDATHTLPPGVDRAVAEICQRLESDPFDAPEAQQLAAAGLTARHLVAAVKAGRLIHIADGIYLRPEAPAQAVERLAGLGRPFTLSQGRQALGTTRRVAVPLFEFLDLHRYTRRVDDTHRAVVPR